MTTADEAAPRLRLVATIARRPSDPQSLKRAYPHCGSSCIAHTESVSHPSSAVSSKQSPALARRIGVFDATMIVMGGIIGSGIFVNPYVVARQVHTSSLILGAWIFGGLVALAGAFVYAELAVLRPNLGGQYAYLRDAYQPGIAFLYGWALLLVIQTGGMAAVAVTFVRYVKELVNLPVPDGLAAAGVLAGLSVINCLGVQFGNRVQSVLMVLKIGTVALLIGIGLTLRRTTIATVPSQQEHSAASLLVAFGAALVPVLFAYGGWQTASFMTGEMRDPKRDLARALLFGVIGVTLIYLGVNVVCLWALGPYALAQTETPVYTVMLQAIGVDGARLVAFAIALSTLGFLSQGMLTTPRVYFAMAKDGLFFRFIASVTRSTRVPFAAILLQGLLAAAIALAGAYEQILSYVVAMDFVFFGLTGLSLFVFKSRSKENHGHRTPGHPFTTIFFIAACWSVVIATFYHFPRNSFSGLGLLILGIPVFLYWKRRRSIV